MGKKKFLFLFKHINWILNNQSRNSKMSKPGSELFHLVKNSRLAQVAEPLLKNIRAKSRTPTHQVIFTPKSSAARSNYGLKTALPGKIGSSHISFNDIDNRQSMPDVEKNSGFYYKQQMFKELGLSVKTHYARRSTLFENGQNKSARQLRDDSLTNALNLPSKVDPSQVVSILKKNKWIFDQFNDFLVKEHPNALLTTIPRAKLLSLLRKYLVSTNALTKLEKHLTKSVKMNSKYERSSIQGTGGFSYNQRGRLTNTPNGIRYGTVVPGRIIDNKEAAIAGFVSSVTDRSIALHTNYAKHYPGKHHRQFVVPFKISEAELADDGSVRLFAEGIKTGKWMETGSRFTPSRTNFAGSSERNKADGESLESLLNLILPTS